MLVISIIIPSYNEEKSILESLTCVMAQAEKLRSDGFKLDVIVIDDGSKDRSVEFLKSRPDLYHTLIIREKNGGKGAAIKDGLAKCQGDYVLFQDADLEYDPDEYQNLLLPIKKFSADVVIGSRIVAPRYLRIHYYWNRMGNALITWVLNVLFNKTFTDIYSCYLLFRRNLLNVSELETSGFEQQAEILSLLVQRAKAMYEVPISYHGRTVEEGKKIRPYHIFSVLWIIFKESVRRRG